MKDLLEFIVYGPSKEYETELFRRWALLLWWLYLPASIIFVIQFPNLVRGNGLIASYFAANILGAFVLTLLCLPVILIIRLTTGGKEATEKFLEKHKTPWLIFGFVIFSIFFLISFWGNLRYSNPLFEKNGNQGVGDTFLIVLSGIFAPHMILRAIEHFTLGAILPKEKSK